MTAVAERTNTDLATRQAAIVTLLERHAELTDPVRAGTGKGGPGVLVMPHARRCAILTSSPPRCTCWRRDVVEVERLLALMRNQAKQQAYHGVSVGTLRHHVLAWYVNATRVGQWQPIVVRKGRKLSVPTGQDVLRTRSGRVVPARYHVSWLREPDARHDRALLGVLWMAEHWGLGHEPMFATEEAA